VVVASAHGNFRGAGSLRPGAKAFIAVRPERMTLDPAAGHENQIELPLRDIVFQGSKVQLHFDAPDGDQVLVETAQLPPLPPAPGTKIALRFSAADAMVFPAEATP